MSNGNISVIQYMNNDSVLLTSSEPVTGVKYGGRTSGSQIEESGTISYNETAATTIFPHVTVLPTEKPSVKNRSDSFCKVILYMDVGESRIKVWDLLLLLPVLIFLIGLLIKLNSARLKLRAVHSPIYATFYGLIWLNTAVALLRCIISMTVSAASPEIDEVNKIMYVVVRFFLLATEMSVIIFAIFFGHLDNKTSIRRVLIVTSVIALPYSVLQGALEVFDPDEDFSVTDDYELFGHGGSLFFLVSSLIFTLVYSLLLVLRLNCLRTRFLFLLWMPMKRAFYMYLAFLAVLNLLQSIGSGLFHGGINAGLCIVNITTWTYFSLLTPLIYYTFIYEFFGRKSRDQVENIVFSYKSEDEDDTNSLPLPSSEYPPAQGGNIAYNNLPDEGGGSGGTGLTSVNPLYTASLQSPDSLTGYSINSADSITITAYDKSQ